MDPIRAADTVKTFLADEAIQAAFASAEDECVTRWKLADTVADRETAHADYRAIAKVRRQLQIVVDRGTVAAHGAQARK